MTNWYEFFKSDKEKLEEKVDKLQTQIDNLEGICNQQLKDITKMLSGEVVEIGNKKYKLVEIK